jgi:hypothetical protein
MLAAIHQIGGGGVDQSRGSLPVLRRERMLDSIIDRAVVRKPRAGAAVKTRYRFG